MVQVSQVNYLVLGKDIVLFYVVRFGKDFVSVIYSNSNYCISWLVGSLWCSSPRKLEEEERQQAPLVGNDITEDRARRDKGDVPAVPKVGRRRENLPPTAPSSIK
jgi:hypothetical protein